MYATGDLAEIVQRAFQPVRDAVERGPKLGRLGRLGGAQVQGQRDQPLLDAIV